MRRIARANRGRQSGLPMDFVSARLRRLADYARAVGDDDFAERFEQYIAHAHEGLSLDQALGLAVVGGGETWFSREHRLRRDEINCEFYVRYCPGETDARRRATLQNALRRYEREAWPHDKILRSMPIAYEGTYRELLFLAFRENESQDAQKPMPTSDDQLRRILASHCLTGRNPSRGPATVEAESRCEPYSDSKTEGMQHHVGKEISIAHQRRRSTGRI
jgi:hypothetical protein